MKKIMPTLLLIIYICLTTNARAQGECDLPSLANDRDTIFVFAKNLDDQLLAPLQAKFNKTEEQHGHAQELFDYIHTTSNKLQLVEETINQIENYLSAHDASCFNSTLKQEIKDYQQSLQLLKTEALHLVSPKVYEMNAFNNLQFIAAYNNMTVSRGLLKQAIDNLLNSYNVTIKLKELKGDVVCMETEMAKLPSAIATAEKNINTHTTNKTLEWGIIGGLIGGVIGGLFVHLLK